MTHVITLLSKGLVRRQEKSNAKPLDIILAENLRDAGLYVKNSLQSILCVTYPIDDLVGLIETSIGKMVPIIPLAELEKDPLIVFAEPYNTLILDGKGFKSPIPKVKGLAPKDNIKAWVDRNAFIHNLGHATAAYYGHSLHPEAVYLYEILEDQNVFRFARNTMLQSADILITAYPNDFAASDLKDHIDDLLHRFRNKALLDTIFRVGEDLTRKLSADDRFMGSIHLAIKYGIPYNLIVEAMSFGFFFRAKDEEGNLFPPDVTFLKSLSNDFESTLINDLGFDPKADKNVIEELKRFYKKQL